MAIEFKSENHWRLITLGQRLDEIKAEIAKKDEQLSKSNALILELLEQALAACDTLCSDICPERGE